MDGIGGRRRGNKCPTGTGVCGVLASGHGGRCWSAPCSRTGIGWGGRPNEEEWGGWLARSVAVVVTPSDPCLARSRKGRHGRLVFIPESIKHGSFSSDPLLRRLTEYNSETADRKRCCTWCWFATFFLLGTYDLLSAGSGRQVDRRLRFDFWSWLRGIDRSHACSIGLEMRPWARRMWWFWSVPPRSWGSPSMIDWLRMYVCSQLYVCSSCGCWMVMPLCIPPAIGYVHVIYYRQHTQRDSETGHCISGLYY